jgi:hypothetical protein
LQPIPFTDREYAGLLLCRDARSFFANDDARLQENRALRSALRIDDRNILDRESEESREADDLDFVRNGFESPPVDFRPNIYARRSLYA